MERWIGEVGCDPWSLWCVKSVIGECVENKGCGDWIVRIVMEMFGVIWGEGVGGMCYVVNSSGMCGLVGGDKAWREARVI